jgi:hypothetical protein
MPWKVVAGSSVGCPASKTFAVVKTNTGEKVACHATRGEAMAHMQALYANTKGEGMVK